MMSPVDAARREKILTRRLVLMSIVEKDYSPRIYWLVGIFLICAVLGWLLFFMPGHVDAAPYISGCLIGAIFIVAVMSFRTQRRIQALVELIKLEQDANDDVASTVGNRISNADRLT